MWWSSDDDHHVEIIDTLVSFPEMMLHLPLSRLEHISKGHGPVISAHMFFHLSINRTCVQLYSAISFCMSGGVCGGGNIKGRAIQNFREYGQGCWVFINLPCVDIAAWWDPAEIARRQHSLSPTGFCLCGVQVKRYCEADVDAVPPLRLEVCITASGENVFLAEPLVGCVSLGSFCVYPPVVFSDPVVTEQFLLDTIFWFSTDNVFCLLIPLCCGTR